MHFKNSGIIHSIYNIYPGFKYLFLFEQISKIKLSYVNVISTNTFWEDVKIIFVNKQNNIKTEV